MDENTMSRLQEASVATIQSQLFRLGLRNVFLYGVRPLNAKAAHFVGPAFTLRNIPAREDIDVMEIFQDPSHPQRVAIETVAPGEVLVVDSRNQGWAASAGHILLTRLAVRGVRAFITDGSVRDSPDIAKLLFPTFCSSVSATTNLALHHAVDMQVPIGCAGVPVYPGDILVGDPEGVVVVPQHLASVVAEPAAEQEQLEAFLQKLIAQGSPLPGTYPPSRDVLEEFRRSKDG